MRFMIIGFFVGAFPVIVLLSLVMYLPLYFYGKKKNGKKPLIRHAVICIYIEYCISLAYLTILWYYPNITFHPKYYFLNLQPFVWVKETYDMGFEKMIQQLALNIGMFVSYGVLLPIIFRKLRGAGKVSMVIFFSTFIIEVVQYFIGRSADVDDIIMNILGGMIGYLIWKILDRILRDKKMWKRLSCS